MPKIETLNFKILTENILNVFIITKENMYRDLFLKAILRIWNLNNKVDLTMTKHVFIVPQ